MYLTRDLKYDIMEVDKKEEKELKKYYASENWYGINKGQEVFTREQTKQQMNSLDDLMFLISLPDVEFWGTNKNGAWIPLPKKYPPICKEETL